MFVLNKFRRQKSWLKYTFGSILLLLFILFLLYGELIWYGMQQGYGQAKVLWHARPVKQVLKDTSVPDSIKHRLRFIQEVRRYAVHELGLYNSDNYTTFYDQGGEPVLWVVTACRPFRLKPYSWHFPFLGALDYKGFFKKSYARQEARRLQEKGYDTDIRTVEAWSTLGWFKDPVLSGMLDGTRGELAELIIHELMHATVFIRDSTQFNENLASFVGTAGAREFLADRYGKDHAHYREYIHQNEDDRTFSRYIVQQAAKLDSFYSSSWFRSLDTTKKRSYKKKRIRKILEGMEELDLHNKKRFKHMMDDKKLPGNTFFMHFLRYRGNMEKIRKQYQNAFNRDLNAYITYLKDNYSSL